MTYLQKIDQYLEEHFAQSLEELKTLCAQPSISAQNLGLNECAALVAQMLEQRGFSVEILPTGGAPAIVAERRGKVDRTLLFYNHYDVQPPEPLDLWVSPPFSPEIRDGKMFARGVEDDKGHITSRLLALDAFLAVEGELPCNVKFLIEGEEEISSVHLADFIRTHQAQLAADACVWEGGGVDEKENPVQCLGMRGILYVELSAETASRDAHSGLGGSIFPNAAWRLVWALNSVKGADERIRIPGFYDRVRPPGARDWELVRALPDDSEALKAMFGIPQFIKGLSGGAELQIEKVFTPTCTICGLTSGYQGAGSKTVLPARALAKMDFRLVPDQDPDEIFDLLRRHLDAGGFSDIQVRKLGAEGPGRTDPDHPFVKLVVDCAQEVYGKSMQIVPMIGGSGPNHAVSHYLKVPIVTSGVGYPDSRAHAPNENMRLDLYLKGARHLTRILERFASQIP